MSKSRGNVIDPWSVLARPRRRRAALVHVLVGLAVDAEAGLRGGHRRGDPPVPAHAVEHLLVLRHLRRPRRLDAAGAAPATRRARTSSTGGSARGCTARCARSPTRSRRSTRSAARRRWPSSSTTSRTGTCAARARASGSRPIRPRTRRCTSASRTIAQLLAPFCPFVTDEMYAQPRVHRRVGAPHRLARVRRRRDRRRRSKPRWTLARALVSLGRAARSDAKTRRAPTAAARDRVARRERVAARRRRAARSPTSST